MWLTRLEGVTVATPIPPRSPKAGQDLDSRAAAMERARHRKLASLSAGGDWIRTSSTCEFAPVPTPQERVQPPSSPQISDRPRGGRRGTDGLEVTETGAGGPRVLLLKGIDSNAIGVPCSISYTKCLFVMTVDKIPPIRLVDPDHIREISERAYQEQCDALLGCAKLIPFALSEGRLQLPVDATFPDPPDIVLSSGQSRLAIEVSRVTWQRQIQVLSEARRRRPGSLVELNPELRVDKKARRGKGGSKGERNRNYGAIKRRAKGWMGRVPLGMTTFMRQYTRSMPRLNVRSHL